VDWLDLSSEAEAASAERAERARVLSSAQKVVADREVTVHGHPGRELTLEGTVFVKYRVFVVHQRLYTLFAELPLEAPDERWRASRFLDSFRLE
jgi:hypothetical protein